MLPFSGLFCIFFEVREVVRIFKQKTTVVLSSFFLTRTVVLSFEAFFSY